MLPRHFASLRTFVFGMLFKWLFTLLAIVWLWLVWRRYVAPPHNADEQPPLPPPPETPPSPEPDVRISPRDDSDKGEYIDFEEIKE